MPGTKLYNSTSEPILKKPTQPFRSYTKFHNFDFRKGKIHGPDLLYQGPMPFCPLLFGRFLYYSGLTNWQTIIKALVWQRNQRPRFGEIGQDLGWLTEDNIIHLLENTGRIKPFGHRAVTQGYITKSQALIILARQRRLHKRLGEYFVKNKICTVAQLADMIFRQHQHNKYVRTKNEVPA